MNPHPLIEAARASMSDPTSVQMVASKSLGGAEHWFKRFCAALGERRLPADVAIRSGGGLDGFDFGPLPVHRLPFLTTWDPLSRRAVTRLIQRIRPDIVQTYMGRATRLTHLPRRGGTLHLARLGGYYALAPYRHAHGWIGNTRALCDWMINQGLPAERVYHIYNFADRSRPVAPEQVAELRAFHGIPDDAWVMLTLGRFIAVKGHAHLISALARLPQTIAARPLRLIMLGDGPLATPLRQQALHGGQDPRMVWPGWQSDPAPYLQMADLVVFPSLDAETFGNVILDAWAWGKPLVTSRFRGAREIARHGEDAWCVPCGDSAALANGIQEMLVDATLRSSIAERGHVRASREFSRDVILDQYLELYRRLAGAD